MTIRLLFLWVPASVSDANTCKALSSIKLPSLYLAHPEHEHSRKLSHRLSIVSAGDTSIFELVFQWLRITPRLKETVSTTHEVRDLLNLATKW